MTVTAQGASSRNAIVRKIRSSLAPSRRAAPVPPGGAAPPAGMRSRVTPGGDRRLRVDAHQVDAERAHRGRQDDRQWAVGQPDLAEQQEERDRDRGVRHHHRAEHEPEQRLAPAEAELGEAVARRGGEQRGRDGARDRIQRRVPDPHEVRASVERARGEQLTDVLEQMEVVGEPEPERPEEVADGLRRGDEQPDERKQEIREEREHEQHRHRAGPANGPPTLELRSGQAVSSSTSPAATRSAGWIHASAIATPPAAPIASRVAIARRCSTSAIAAAESFGMASSSDQTSSSAGSSPAPASPSRPISAPSTAPAPSAWGAARPESCRRRTTPSAPFWTTSRSTTRTTSLSRRRSSSASTSPLKSGRSKPMTRSWTGPSDIAVASSLSRPVPCAS